MMSEVPLALEVVLGILAAGGIMLAGYKWAAARYVAQNDERLKEIDKKFGEIAAARYVTQNDDRLGRIDQQFEAIEPRLQSHFNRMQERVLKVENDMDAVEKETGKHISLLHERLTTLLTEWPDRFVTRHEFDRLDKKTDVMNGKLDDIWSAVGGTKRKAHE